MTPDAPTPTPAEGWVAAVDLGATSGRVLVGRVHDGSLEIDVVHRFPNQPVRTPDGLRWNVLELYRQVLTGLREAVRRRPGLVSIGICSWAVDYGLVRVRDDAPPLLVGSPFHYRDDRTARGVEAVHAVVEPDVLYQSAGLQFLPFNTLYQLAVDAADGQLDDRTRALLLPDLFGHWLTGALVAERTNASTTGLLDVRTGGWNTTLLDKLGLPGGLLPDLVEPGTRIGAVTGAAADELGLDPGRHPGGPALVAVGSHDTASAVVAVPMADPTTAAYISSGTWSLVGLELDAPVLTEDARAAGFTNEGGVDDRIRFLHNVMGLWLLNESVRRWERDGVEVDLPALLADAADVDPAEVPVFDAEDDSLLRAGDDMPERIAALCGSGGAGLTGDTDRARVLLVRSICASLAAAYAATLESAERLSGRRVEVIHVVGGGSQNPLLCQLTADRTGRRVLAGPVEATAIGNVLVQSRAAGTVSGGLAELRTLVADAHPPTGYEPR
ncbi:rhamnulokinase [Friedmanniella endophytica]|uniref:Rhamnulokinase n=1 Tax=Microlunatus kandeliicorticis TaxID=1759536 RepID=A0A7W3IP18_9ACTN|nr:rhamnulokinase family protein [Microlunatus kandeliicorticis]MBA8792592.1 rhamnulokinase [Microlunatus kandeliicorticis]